MTRGATTPQSTPNERAVYRTSVTTVPGSAPPPESAGQAALVDLQVRREMAGGADPLSARDIVQRRRLALVWAYSAVARERRDASSERAMIRARREGVMLRWRILQVVAVDREDAEELVSALVLAGGR